MNKESGLLVCFTVMTGAASAFSIILIENTGSAAVSNTRVAGFWFLQ